MSSVQHCIIWCAYLKISSILSKQHLLVKIINQVLMYLWIPLFICIYMFRKMSCWFIVDISFQFICKKYGELSAQHLQSLDIGQKDFHKDLFFIWKSIFQLPKPSRKPFAFRQLAPNNNAMATNNVALPHIQGNAGLIQSSNSKRFHNILHLASANSEYEKMTQGLWLEFHATWKFSFILLYTCS